MGQLTSGALNQAGAFSSWGDWGGQLARATVSGMAAGTTAAVMRGGRVSVQQVATDAFGNALGSSLASLSSGASTGSSRDPLGDFIDRNMPAWEQRQAHYDQLATAFGHTGSIDRSGDVTVAALDGFSLGQRPVQSRGVQILPDGTRQLILDDTDSGAGDASSDRWTPYGTTPQEGGTTTGRRMTPQEMAEFDRLNPGLADAERIKSYGSISANPPPIWERVLLDQDVRRVMGNTVTGKVFDAFLNSAGNAGAAFLSPTGYNFATGQHLNPVQRREARINSVIDWATMPLLGAAGAVRGRVGVDRIGGASSLVQAETSALRQIAINNQAPSPAAALRQAYQQARGQVDFAHIEADVSFKANGQIRAQGGHFSTSPLLQRIPCTEAVSPNGVIYGQVKLLGPDGNFHLKTNNQGFSSMTPDSWSLAQAKGAMSQAWLNRALNPAGEWTGMSGG